MKYLRGFNKFVESVDVESAPVKQNKKVLKSKGPVATTEDIVNRIKKVSKDSLKKLIEG